MYWLALSMILGAALSLAFGYSDRVTPVDYFFEAANGAWFGVLCILPIGVIHLGIRKLRAQRQVETEALGDDNTVTADPDGPRKTHEYLTAITSVEARIGLLQRSEPWPAKRDLTQP